MKVHLETESARATLDWLSPRGYDGGFEEFGEYDTESESYVFEGPALASFRDLVDLDQDAFLACNGCPELREKLGALYDHAVAELECSQWGDLQSLLDWSNDCAKWEDFETFQKQWVEKSEDFESWKKYMGEGLSPAMHKYLSEDDLIQEEN